MTDFFTQMRAAFAEHIERFQNRDFLEAAMAATALVSMADGTVNLTEANTVDQALEAVQQLKIYDPHEAVDLFHHHIDALRDDPAGEKDRILEIVDKIAGDEQEARILIRICVAIGKSDGNFMESEQAVIRELARRLELDPAGIDM